MHATPAVQYSGTGTPHAHDEAKFREDFEKLVIGRMEFDVIDQNLIPPEDRPAPREFPRSDIPYPYASRPQILAYKAFTKLCGGLSICTIVVQACSLDCSESPFI